MVFQNSYKKIRSDRKGDKMETMVFVVTVIDFAYKTPKVNIAYAGLDMQKAYDIYNSCVACSDRMQINLDLVQGENVRRLEILANNNTDEIDKLEKV